MKIRDAVFYTDNTTVRLETEKVTYYLDSKGKFYDMHPVNVMANEISGSILMEVKKAAKNGKYKDSDLVVKWI